MQADKLWRPPTIYGVPRWYDVNYEFLGLHPDRIIDPTGISRQSVLYILRKFLMSGYYAHIVAHGLQDRLIDILDTSFFNENYGQFVKSTKM